MLVDEAGVEIARAEGGMLAEARARNGMLVRMPRTGNARSAAIARAIAAFARSAVTISFASSGS